MSITINILIVNVDRQFDSEPHRSFAGEHYMDISVFYGVAHHHYSDDGHAWLQGKVKLHTAICRVLWKMHEGEGEGGCSLLSSAEQMVVEFFIISQNLHFSKKNIFLCWFFVCRTIFFSTSSYCDNSTAELELYTFVLIFPSVFYTDLFFLHR